MKIKKSEHFIRTSSSMSGQSFGVRLSDKLFETLYGNLYRYKEAAVVREILCNAIDTHQMRDRYYRTMASHYASLYAVQGFSVSKYLAPRGTKVVVHLPDEYEPWLEIRDYGVGLSLEQIIGKPIIAKEDEVLLEGNIVCKEENVPEDAVIAGVPEFYGEDLVFRHPDSNEIIRKPGLYTTLFDSTKEDDNDQVGAFGLGSKSPFAISDSFTVEARFEGKIHRFLMFLNDQRIPNCDLITKDLITRDPLPLDTEECNGLTINVPIKSHHFERFQNELAKLISVMEPHMIPEVENCESFTYHLIDRSHRVADTFIQKKESSHYNTTHYAVMGGVAYPIDNNQLDEEIRGLLQRFPQTYTFFGLGDLNIPPSREDLSYDEFTRDSINTSMRGVRDHILEQAIQDLREQFARGPLWAFIARGRYSDLYGKGFNQMMDQEFPRDSRLNHEGKFKFERFEAQFDYAKDTIVNEPIDRHFLPFSLTSHDRWNGRGEAKLNATGLSNEEYIFVLLDNNRCYLQKIRHLTVTESKTVILITPTASLIYARDLDEKTTPYLNQKELTEYIAGYVGTGPEVDWLKFADKFSAGFDGLCGIDIRFMSELTYDRVAIRGNLGLLQYSHSKANRNSVYRFEGSQLKAERIEEITETGVSIVYLEANGNDVTQMVGHRRLKITDLSTLNEAINKLTINTDISSAGYLGSSRQYHKLRDLHGGFILVRKMGLKFLRDNPDMFTSFDDYLKGLYEFMKPFFELLEFSWAKSELRTIRSIRGNQKYMSWILGNTGNVDLQKQLADMADKNDQLLVIAEESSHRFAEQNQGDVANIFRRNKDSIEKLQEFFTDYGFHTKSIDANVMDDYIDDYERLVGVIGRLVGTDLTKSDTTYGTYSPGRKASVRMGIEAILVQKFVRENYKPVMGNALEGTDAFIGTIVKSIKRR